MAKQINLTWNSLTLCDSTTAGGYVRTSYNPKRVNRLEKSIPNSDGRFERIIGTGLSGDTSLSLSFHGEKVFASIALAQTFEQSVEDKMASTTNTLGSLTYGHYNVNTNITETNMSLDDYKTTELWVDSAGNWHVEFDVSFSKWGE